MLNSDKQILNDQNITFKRVRMMAGGVGKSQPGHWGSSLSYTGLAILPSSQCGAHNTLLGTTRQICMSKATQVQHSGVASSATRLDQVNKKQVKPGIRSSM